MTTFIFTYRHPSDYVPVMARDGGQPPTDADNETSAAWGAFFERIGPRVVDPGQPVVEGSAIGEVGASTKLAGYSVIEAGDRDEAMALAKECPTLARGGGVEIGVLAQLPPDHPAALLKNRTARA